MPEPRCTGHCCDSFSLDMAAVKRIAGRGDSEAIQIRDMVRPLLPGSWNGFVGRNVSGADVGFVFTCTNLGPDHDCAIYATRPAMCSRYPYGSRCTHPDCTSTEAKRLPERCVEDVTGEAVSHA